MEKIVYYELDNAYWAMNEVSFEQLLDKWEFLPIRYVLKYKHDWEMQNLVRIMNYDKPKFIRMVKKELASILTITNN